MPVQWNWEKKEGEVVWKVKPNCTDPKVVERGFSWSIYPGNCLAVFIFEFIEEESNEEMYKFMTFFNDIHHMKKCLGLEKDYKGEKVNLFNDLYRDYEIDYIKLDTNYPDWEKLSKAFIEAGFEVRLNKGGNK